ncbi:MAG: hypothetical protein Tsb0026_19330 [Sulfuricaulis sp.]
MLISKNYRLSSWVVIIPSIVSVIAGCAGASHIPLSQSDKNSIRSVSINQTVTLPETVTYRGPEASIYAVFGAVGAMVGSVANKSNEEVLKQFMEKNGIDAAAIVKEQLNTQLHDSQMFSNVVQNDADAQFKIDIVMYGLSNGGNGSKLKPWLVMNVALIKSDGRVVWQKYLHDISYDDLRLYSLGQYVEKPELLKIGLEKHARVLFKSMNDDLLHVNP